MIFSQEGEAMLMKKNIVRMSLIAGLFIAGLAAALAASLPALELGLFSKASVGGDFPQGWEPLLFPKIEAHTQYTLVEDEGAVVVQAESKGSSSGMICKKEIDPVQYPVMEWRWKVTSVYEKGDVTQKSGDDYPARMYVSFKYDPSKVGFWERAKYKTAKVLYGEYPPHGAINYIWASNAPKGTVAPNPFSDRVKMIAVESGKENLGQWVLERRNILEDYRNAFGEEPPMIAGIAIMTDSDNTGDQTVSYYGDIVLKSE
ncbi:conserved hypothetical protein [Desulfatibacillum aliphaticivorans]|uniref:DUF3047 domain-containing protein n=2 Tax=Desulfatibacillum aliphaticivorans TaxID=218208 RepID=B8FJ05_DESAL|nr:conserved hypothetical protein [Desulfatibacillum aliphaticivorans]